MSLATPSPDDLRAALVHAIANLRHAYAQPNLDRGIANGLLAPEIRRLEGVLEDWDAHERELGALVGEAAAKRQALIDRVAQVEQALTRIGIALAPVAHDGQGEHARAAIALALDQIHACGIVLPDVPPEPPA